MTSQPVQTPDPVDGGSAHDPVGRVGREIIRQVDLDRLAALIERRASAALLEELAGIAQAPETADPHGSGRRGGIVGRLLGRDLAAQARAREAHDHIRIRLQLADRRAADVRAHIAELDEAIAHVLRQRVRLAEITDRGRAALEAFALSASRPDAMERRLEHLAVLVSSWDVAIAHMRLVRQYGDLLLARYAHVRDAVVPQWRRQAEAALAVERRDPAPAGEPLREALASLLQSTSPEPAVFPTASDVRV